MFSSETFMESRRDRLLARAQEALRDVGIEAWLLYDYRQRNPVAAEIAQLHPYPTRPWFCLIPQAGPVLWMAPRIEVATSFSGVEGTVFSFGSRAELLSLLKHVVSPYRVIGMEYSPDWELPHLSAADAGVVGLLKRWGVDVISSADLVHRTLGIVSDYQLETHKIAARKLIELTEEAFAFISHRLNSGDEVTEWTVAEFLLSRFREEGLVTDHPPIVAVMGNSRHPHYFPSPERSAPIGWGDFVLLDLFARTHFPSDSVYADITWCGYTGTTIPPRFEAQFQRIREARDRALDFLTSTIPKGEPVRGCEVDQVVRSYFESISVADLFPHRTGHSLGSSVHGWGANLDSFETVDERVLVPGSLFTIEPGLYGSEIGTRSEINVFVSQGGIEVTTVPLQQQIAPII